MAAFALTEQDLLIVSLAVNMCVMIQLLLDRLVTWIAPILGDRNSMIQTLVDLNKKRPGLIARVAMEQLTLWTLIALILIALTYTSVSLLPFSHQPSPYPSFLIRAILGSGTARFLVIASRIVLVRDIVLGNTGTRHRVTAGQTGRAKLDFLYMVSSATGNLICLGYNENLLLGLTASFVELSSTPLECCRLIKLAKRHQGSVSYRKTTILACALCIFFRVIMPLLFLGVAFKQESLFVMDVVPVVWFFLSAAFFSVFHLILLYQSVKRVVKATRNTPDPPQTCQYSSSNRLFSIYDYPGMLSNILENKESLQHEETDSKYTQLKEFSYGFLRSCDNRNLTGTSESEEQDKMNITKKKEISKHSLLYKISPIYRGESPKRGLSNQETSDLIDRSSSNDCLLYDGVDCVEELSFNPVSTHRQKIEAMHKLPRAFSDSFAADTEAKDSALLGRTNTYHLLTRPTKNKVPSRAKYSKVTHDGDDDETIFSEVYQNQELTVAVDENDSDIMSENIAYSLDEDRGANGSCFSKT